MAILRVIGDSLCQWDTGRKVLISVPANTDIKRVDFKSCAVDEMMGMRVFVEEGRLVAEIPNIMLQYPEEITAYVVMRHSVDNERTILINTFEVEPKDKPPGYACDQQEILRFESLEERITKLEKGNGGSGEPGADGFSPEAKVEETEDGAKITITDKSGTTEATVKHGKDGADGYTPVKGTDYFTEEDKQELIQSVFAQVVNGNEVAY